MEHNLGPLAQIPPGEGRNFRIDAITVAVFHTRSGEVYATQPDCPHRQGPLADGLIGGATLLCPLHDRAWDLRTGAATSGAPPGEDCPIAIYPARLAPDQSILLTLPN